MKNKNLFIILIVLLIAGVVYFRADIRKGIAASFFKQGSDYFGGVDYNLGKAEKWYKAALKIEPKLSNAHYQLARVYFVKNNFSKALTEINSELSLNPENKRSYYVRGLINGYSGDYQAAAEDFKKFIAWQPNEWAGYNDLAWVYNETGDYSKSKEMLLEGLKIAPDNAWLLNGLSVVLSKLGEQNESDKVLEQAKISAEKIDENEWQMAYSANNPAFALRDLSEFKNNLGQFFAPACNSGTYWACSGLSCSGFICDPDHEICSSGCTTKCDCGPQTDVWINSSDGPLTLEQYANYTLGWESCQSSCDASGSWNVSGLAPTGSQSFNDIMRGSYNYNMNCSGPGAATSNDLVAVNVIKVPNCSFYADPSNIPVLPATSTLFWDCRYPAPHNGESSADTCSIDQEIGNVNPSNGSQDVRPTKTTTYTLTCSAVDGTKTYQTTVTIGYSPRIREVNPVIN
ncbi:MAG: tetratricopeptide repeat protein [Patescibacteria group bacterium]